MSITGLSVFEAIKRKLLIGHVEDLIAAIAENPEATVEQLRAIVAANVTVEPEEDTE